MSVLSTDLTRSVSLPVVSRRHRATPTVIFDVDLSAAGAATRSSSSTPSRLATQPSGCGGRSSWKSRQAASIESCLRRQQKEKVRASQERDRRARTLRTAKHLSLQCCSNPELKAWALAQADQDTTKVICAPTASLEMMKSRSEMLAPVPNYHRLCGFLPTDDESISPLCSVLRLEPDDVFYDLGCGDGKVVIKVVKHFRCRGIGIEVNRLLVQKARSQAESEFCEDSELQDRISFIEDDISHVSLSNAKAVFIYMPDSALHTLLVKVLPHCGLKDGTLVCTKDNWVREGTASRNYKYVASHWGGGIHCYKWQKSDSHPGDAAWT